MGGYSKSLSRRLRYKTVNNNQEQRKVKNINYVRKLLELAYDLPDALEDALFFLTGAIMKWGKEEQQRWEPGQVMFFEIGRGVCHFGGFGWRPKLDDYSLSTVPNTPKLWGMIADDIENGDGLTGVSLSLAMMVKDGLSRAREYTQTTPAGQIPTLIILAFEDQGEDAGYIGLISIPTLSALETEAA